MEKVSGCSEDKAQFYFLVTPARGRGDGLSMTDSVKSTVPRPKAAAGSAARRGSPLVPAHRLQRSDPCWVVHEHVEQDRAVFCERSSPPPTLHSHVMVRGWSWSGLLWDR